MPSDRRAPGWRLPYARLAVTLSIGLAAAACASTPAAPGDSAFDYIGTWTGSVVNEAAGEGVITVVFDAQRAGTLTGMATLTFPDSRFDSTRMVQATFGAGVTLSLFFDRATVPCPREPAGVAARTMVATLARTGNRLQGSYIAGGCPGGAMDLAQQ